MKVRILSKLVAILFMTINVTGQSFNLRAGLGLTKQLDKDNSRIYSENYCNKFSLNAGFTYENLVNGKTFIEYGLGIESKGFQVANQSTNVRVKISPIYVHAPILLKFTQPFKNKIRFYENIGIYAAYGIGGKLKIGDYDFDSKEAQSINWGKEVSEDYKPLDFGLTFGVGMENDKIQYGLLYDLGMANISPTSTDGNVIRNRALKFYFGIKVAKKKATDSPPLK